MTLTHWKKLDNPDYLGAYAFQPDEVKTVTISGVKREIVCSPEGKKQEKTVVRFADGVKPLVLNSGNGKMISKVLGTSYIEEWTGGRIMLHVEKVKAFGDVVDAVRVMRDKPPAVKKEPVPSCADCHQPIKPWGNMTAQQVAASTRNRFSVSVCFDCGQKRAEALRAEKDESEKTEPIQHDSDKPTDEEPTEV